MIKSLQAVKPSNP